MKTIAVRLPKIGESTQEARIVEWLKKPGDAVEKDELFAVIGTDKVDSEIFSEYTGTLTELLVNEGDEAKVGQEIARMEVLDDTVESAGLIEENTSPAALAKDDANKPIMLKQQTELGFLSPVVRKIAAEHGISLQQLQGIRGTGENGRIRKIDVEAFLQPSQPLTTKSREKIDLKADVGEQLQTLTGMRRRIADNMENSWQAIPHVTTFIDADVTGLVNYRDTEKEKFLAENGAKLTYTHLIMHGVLSALMEFPAINAWFNGEELLLKHSVNLGFATALPDGNLIVPNIKNAQEMSVAEIAKAVAEISERARNNKLRPDDIGGTTFTVSNTGIFGSKMGTPIIAQPQVAVLALGSILRRPWVVQENGGEELAIRSVMALSLSYDHRVIDGALASQFLTAIKKNLENYKS